ncbi:uncharacterized protein LY79DRAFT_538763 [Colletotrichum navitas]|uniref:Uncharacterized protein n=1 Tax=Colletotrichum navitas TaxID=681940 RepID=A0AAD8QA87_9PEZI|nr:uncharacterized protein LY79DRAFT_538763 [Colletotrichum navitas]KAK1598301.1 hypothetical protein LY79DRAFT_538763 [Colletotrichum navitas]
MVPPYRACQRLRSFPRPLPVAKEKEREGEAFHQETRVCGICHASCNSAAVTASFPPPPLILAGVTLSLSLSLSPSLSLFREHLCLGEVGVRCDVLSASQSIFADAGVSCCLYVHVSVCDPMHLSHMRSQPLASTESVDKDIVQGKDRMGGG